jgi:hypothetical protein
MPKLLFIIQFAIFALGLTLNPLVCNGDNAPTGGRSAGMGNASVALSDFWSVQNNQAGMADYNKFAVGFAYENKFLVNNLRFRTGAFILPSKFGSFGLIFQQFGYSAYSQSKIGLGYARKLGEGFSAGLQLDYLITRLGEDYGSAQSLTFELGFLAKLTPQLVLGAHVFNPINAKIEDEYNERIPAVYKLGLAYSITDELIIALETEKNMDYKPLVRGGVEYEVSKLANVRIGYSSVPSKTGSDKFSISTEMTFGFGLDLQRFMLDFAASWHQTLGWSPGVSFIFKFNKGEP